VTNLIVLKLLEQLALQNMPGGNDWQPAGITTPLMAVPV